MRRRVWCLGWCLTLIVAACGTSTGGTPDSSSATTSAPTPPSPVAPTSTTPVPETTTTTPAAGAVPAWFRFGDDGLWFVDEGSESRLIGDPVSWAATDYLGGVVFRYSWQMDRPGTYRLAAGTTEPVLVSTGSALPTRLDGRATLLLLQQRERDADYVVDAIEVLDLVTGDRTIVDGAFGDGGQDSSLIPSTAGGAILAGVGWLAVGTCFTNTVVGLWSIDVGGPFQTDANPYGTTCEPCTIDVALSPDGSQLAVLYSPNAKWPCPEADALDDDDWLAAVTGDDVELMVLDIDGDTPVWIDWMTYPAGLLDFDGRYLVAWTGASELRRSIIFDTLGIDDPIDVDGTIVLDRAPEVSS